MLTVVSKSKSNPSITALPKGRGTEELAAQGPKYDQISSALLAASADEEKPLSGVVAPPRESRIVLPYVF